MAPNADVEKGNPVESSGTEVQPANSAVGKNAATQSTVSEVPPEDKAVEVRNPERLQGSFTSIIYGALLPCIVVFTVTGVLLGFIFKYRVIPKSGWPELALPNPNQAHEGILDLIEDWRLNGGSNFVYYVNYQPTRLTMIASWTGKVIPYLTSSIMALFAFFAARRIVEASKNPESMELPSPHQLTLLIGLLGGSSYAPMKDTIKYRWTTKQRLVNPIPQAFWALAFVTGIGLLIPIADTWFSAAVQSVIIVQLSQETSPASSGRGLNSSACSTLTADNTRLPCTIDGIGTGTGTHYDLAGAAESCMTMNAVSDMNTVQNYSSDGETYYFLADTGLSKGRDFRTKTMAISTQCSPMTSTCFRGAQKTPQNTTVLTSTKFSCSPGFTGNVTSNGVLPVSNWQATSTPNVGIGFAPDPSLSNMLGSNSSEIVYASYQNPLYFGAWAIGYPSASPDEPMTLLSDPEVFADQYSDYVWMLNCSTSIYDATYSWVNGSVYNFTKELAQPEMGGVISAPFTMGIHMAQLALGLTSTMAGFQVDSAQLAMMWSQLFSSYTVAITAGAMETVPNLLEQSRNDALGVTRVPIVPLYFLLGLKFLYAFAAIVLALAAIRYTNPAETQSVKERLSVKGLATAYFADGPSQQATAVKNVTELFEEKKEGTEAEKKVGMVQAETGGWRFVEVVAGKIWKDVGPYAQKEVLADANKGMFGKDGEYAADVYTVLK
jgi:hypothetical protein